MARTDVNTQDLTGPYGGEPGQISWTSGDTSEGMNVDINPNGKVILMVRNEDTSDHTFDIITVDTSDTNRKEDITGITVTKGETIAKLIELDGFDQGNQNLHIDNVANSNLEFAAVQLP